MFGGLPGLAGGRPTFSLQILPTASEVAMVDPGPSRETEARPASDTSSQGLAAAEQEPPPRPLQAAQRAEGAEARATHAPGMR